MPAFLATAFLVLAIAILEGGLAPRGPHLRALLALAALAPVFVYLARGTARRSPGRVVALVVGLAAFAGWYALSGATASVGAEQYLLLAAAVGFLALAQDDPESDREALAAALSLTTFGFAAFVAVRDHLTLWPLLGPVSERLTEAAASVLGGAARLGPSYSGGWFVVAIAIAMIARVAVGRRESSWRSALAVALLVVIPLLAVGLRGLGLVSVRFLHIPVDVVPSRAVPFVLLLVPMWLFVRAYPLRRGEAPLAGARVGSVLGVLVVVGMAGIGWSPHVPARTGKVLLDARGDFTLEPPKWGAYGPNAEQGASLSSLPPYLEARGFSVAVNHDPLSASVLAEQDALVVMNPAFEWSPEELSAVWGFVERGGGLLVLGDHTNIKGTMAPLNELLGPSGIRVRFDSAIPQVPRWTWYNCMRIHPHTLTRGLRDETDVKVSVGASLGLPLDALLLFTGRDAFSDAGDWGNEKGAYLGNMVYDPGEPLGDIPLAATASHGRGKVVVFGDTSPFQRTAVVYTHEFLARVFAYLSTPGAQGPDASVRLAGAVVIAASALGLVLLGRRGLPGAVLASVVGAALLLGVAARGRVEVAPLGAGHNVAWVDLAHESRVDLHGGEPIAINGFVDHLTRCGYLPLAMKRFDARGLEVGSLFAAVAPAAPFTGGERRALREFVERGGLLLVAVGYEERNGAEGLLRDFGYEIGGTPLGAAHASESALPGQHVFMHESWPVLRPEGRGEVWVSSWGYPLVVFERVGRGGILVIGDSKFVCDVKLESREAFVEPNIDFLRAAIETARERIGGGEDL